MLAQKIYIKIRFETNRSQHQFILYGVMTFIGYLGFYSYNQYFQISPTYENFKLRLFASILALGLALHKFWPSKVKFLLPCYWYFTLFFNLPVFFVFMLLMNDCVVTWQLNVLSAFILLVILIDWKSAIFLGILGTFTGYMFFTICHKHSLLINNFIGLMTSYAIVIVYLSAFLHKKSSVMEEKILSLRYQSGAIAHEMRTPLANILMNSKILNLTTDRLEQLSKKIHSTQTLSLKDEIAGIRDIAQSLEQITNSSQNLINLILANLKPNLTDLPFKMLSIVQRLDHALEELILNDKEKSKVTVNILYDFQFEGNLELITHIFFNLFKNSFYFIQAAGKGEIFITISSAENFNIVSFKDTGPGIKSSELSHLFEPFYSQRPHGTGLGLSFCKNAMETMNGRISVESSFGKYTTFTLNFPKLAKN